MLILKLDLINLRCLYDTEKELTIIAHDPVVELMCSTCNRNDKILTDAASGEVICSKCGTVISDKVQDITRPERLAFNIEKNIRSRTGVPLSLTFADMGLSTVIGKYDRDANGRPLDSEMRNRMQRLRMWDLRAHSRAAADR